MQKALQYRYIYIYIFIIARKGERERESGSMVAFCVQKEELFYRIRIELW